MLYYVVATLSLSTAYAYTLNEIYYAFRDNVGYKLTPGAARLDKDKAIASHAFGNYLVAWTYDINCKDISSYFISNRHILPKQVSIYKRQNGTLTHLGDITLKP